MTKRNQLIKNLPVAYQSVLYQLDLITQQQPQSVNVKHLMELTGYERRTIQRAIKAAMNLNLYKRIRENPNDPYTYQQTIPPPITN